MRREEQEEGRRSRKVEDPGEEESEANGTGAYWSGIRELRPRGGQRLIISL
jgi:hypothetical protein